MLDRILNYFGLDREEYEYEMIDVKIHYAVGLGLLLAAIAGIVFHSSYNGNELGTLLTVIAFSIFSIYFCEGYKNMEAIMSLCKKE